MRLVGYAAATAGLAVLLLAPEAVRAAKPLPAAPVDPGWSGTDTACMQWLLGYLRTGDKDMLQGDAKVRLLWREPVAKPGKFLKKVLGGFNGEVYWDSVTSHAGEGMLGCSVLMGMDREIGKQGWIHGVDLYARYDLVEVGGGLRGKRVTLVLEYEQNEKSGAIFERPLGSCNVGEESGLVPDELCAVLTFHDTPRGGPDSEIWTTRDITEVLIFGKSGHLLSYERLGVLEQTDDGSAPLGFMEVTPVDLGLGTKVVAVRKEKSKHLGGKGECASYAVTATLSYHALVKGSLCEIFSTVVDVFTDAPCASDAQLDKMTDIVVNVEPMCSGEGPCDLLLEFDQVSPVERRYGELWRFDGKKYGKVETTEEGP